MDFSDWATFPTFPTLFSSSARKRNTNRPSNRRRCTASLIPLYNQNRQLDDYQILISGQACARYPEGWGWHSQGGYPAYRRPYRRPNYACCSNQNETVALFCKVNAKRWCLLAEPSPCGGTIIHQINIKYQPVNYY